MVNTQTSRQTNTPQSRVMMRDGQSQEILEDDRVQYGRRYQEDINGECGSLKSEIFEYYLTK